MTIGTPGATGAAQRSPYSLVQEFLNRSVQHRWGFVSNGLRLVVLHDNVSLVRASNVEFDLESMLEGEVYPDFFLLFSLCHQSRVEILAEERPEECWLEKWSKLAEEQGTRAREKLRVGVERAIQTLGTGFRTARGNSALNEALRTGTLETQEFYRELLRMVYRILLLLVAEDKRLGEDQNLLHPPDSTPEARQPLWPVLLTWTAPEAGVAATGNGPLGPPRVAQDPLREAAGWICLSRHPWTRFVPVLARDDPAPR